MAYSDFAALRFREALGARADLEQKHMMGGLVFMAGGHMMGGVDRDKAGNDRFMFRVGPHIAPAALQRPGATQVMMGTRPMNGFIFVDARVCDDGALAKWICLVDDFIATLQPRVR